MQDYELMYVLTPELDEAGVEEANTRVTTMLATRGGEVSGVDAGADAAWRIRSKTISRASTPWCG